jgi:hypothetical protein
LRPRLGELPIGPALEANQARVTVFRSQQRTTVPGKRDPAKARLVDFPLLHAIGAQDFHAVRTG